MNREREACCDDLALKAGHDKLVYAGSLLRMAELSYTFNRSGRTNQDELSLAASGHHRSFLEQRIDRLLDPSTGSQLRLCRSGWTMLVTLCFLLPIAIFTYQWTASADEPNDQKLSPVQAENGETKTEVAGQTNEAANDQATKIGRASHDRAAAIDQLSRFYWASDNGTLSDFVLENPSNNPLDNLIRSLDAPDAGSNWYRYHAEFGWDENHLIEAMADEAYEHQMMDQLVVQRLQKPYEALIGKPAPVLPNENWIGGERPKLDGTPYLVHFWATWCGPCKNDLPFLKRFAESGGNVVGMHPDGTDASDVRAAIKEARLSYPTYLSTTKSSPDHAVIAGYPATIYPYYVLVDADGMVVAYGSLSENGFDLFAQYRELVEGSGKSIPQRQRDETAPSRPQGSPPQKQTTRRQ